MKFSTLCFLFADFDLCRGIIYVCDSRTVIWYFLTFGKLLNYLLQHSSSDSSDSCYLCIFRDVSPNLVFSPAKALRASKHNGIWFVAFLRGYMNSCEINGLWKLLTHSSQTLSSTPSALKSPPWVNATAKLPLTSSPGFGCARELTQSQSCVGEIL